MTSEAVEVRGASTHNLQSIDCRIPHGKVTVVTGPSGAGKSSLAFDTVYAEAQRRFVESMSTYTRQFLDKMERPPVESLEGVLPAVALVAHNSIQNARSTVGTLTEVHDVLRLLFTHVGEVMCPNGHGVMLSAGPSEVADRIFEAGGASRTVVANMARPSRDADLKLRELIRQGYFRVQDGDELVRLEEGARWLKRWDPLPVVIGRFKPSKETRTRLTAAIEEAYRLAQGRVEILGAPDSHFSLALTCSKCGETASRPAPALFSFNSPLGACSQCQGFGRVIGVDRERVIPDRSKSLRERPIAVWNSPAYEKRYGPLFDAAEERGLDLDLPLESWADEDIEFLWSGKGGGYRNLDRFFRWLERRNYRVHIRVLLARYRSYEDCPRCAGNRLKPEALRVLVHERTIGDLSGWSIEKLQQWFDECPWSDREREVAGHLIEQLGVRIETLCRVGLDYLSLDRQGRTLSGGEAQRIQLASALGSGLTTTLYVLDEPTVGLHPQDSGRLLGLLQDLAKGGNTVLVVEHDRCLIEGADHVIDLGPKAGRLGGRVVAEGTLEDVLKSEESLTAVYLKKAGARDPGNALAEEAVEALPRIGVRGARENNLRDVDVEFPLGCLVVVSGVSGSGKSTLVHRVLHDTFQRSQGVVDVEPGECDELVGFESLEDVILVDQRPLGRSSRSNPVTYIKAYDEIRKLYATTTRARRDGIKAGAFSFNVEGGRCPECQGTGQQEVDMHFMASVRVRCDTCQGRRFQRKVLDVLYRGLSIAETLELTVEEALSHFREERRLRRRLKVLMDVGLGYLHLGQPTATLSGGEAQRLKLASFLDSRKGKDSKPRLFLFDEPTTGLHMADIDLLHGTLRRLIEAGNGVLVVEHSLDLVSKADWIIDLGPGGGSHGGEVLFSGTLQSFLAEGEGPTAVELRAHVAN